MTAKFEPALQSRNDLAGFGDNAILLFALGLRFQVDDLPTVAANALTDGSDDKKCDLVYVDIDGGYAVVAQGYYAQVPTKQSAPSNKASDLNTAAAWLFSRPLDELPDRIKPAAREVRDALANNQITAVHFWYVHNLPESDNVQDELKTVELTVQSALRTHYPSAGVQEISALEVGRRTLDEWYRQLTTPILVSDTYEIPAVKGYTIAGDNWSAYVTAIPARWLHDAFADKGELLFSANVRGYLGSRKSKSNINNNIKSTVLTDPGHFWVYNNGLTILVHNVEEALRNGHMVLKVTGLSIVNGAQTTGAIGSIKAAPSDTAMVPVRFVQCDDPQTVKLIIDYNNSQNPVKPSDFRSKDQIQDRLRLEFGSIPAVTYLGGRRGGSDDFIRRPPNLLPSDTAAQALAAFHGNPVGAYNEKSKIWTSDELYARYFNERTHAPHIVFAYSLLRAVESKKQVLIKREETLTEQEAKQLAYLRSRGATFLTVAAISACLETLLDKQVPDRFRLSFGTRVSPMDAQDHWSPIVDITLSFCDHLVPAIRNGLKSNDDVREAIGNFKNAVQGLLGSLKLSGYDGPIKQFGATITVG